jgi:ADP-ribose pyrophosphatase YjhB (NUDIX family)
MREVEQVAAVCYRIRQGEIEFLLVQTRGSGRWTFPKGGAEAGLTHAQAAAIEASEEAGVHGRIEEAAFAQYFCRRGAGAKCSAHLCEVTQLGPPKEAGRNRTWFAARDAKTRLCDRRTSEQGRELLRVVEKAVERIRSLVREQSFITSRRTGFSRDEWNRVGIEADFSNLRMAGAPPPRIQRLAAIQQAELTSDEIREDGVNPFGSLPQAGRDSKLLSITKKFKALGSGTRVQ